MSKCSQKAKSKSKADRIYFNLTYERSKQRAKASSHTKIREKG